MGQFLCICLPSNVWMFLKGTGTHVFSLMFKDMFLQPGFFGEIYSAIYIYCKVAVVSGLYEKYMYVLSSHV